MKGALMVADIQIPKPHPPLLPHQLQAIEELSNGKILWGGVGVGKSRTVLGYYTAKETASDIYVITTAKKRDSGDWEWEAAKFGISTESDLSTHGQLTVDSWNNISKYEGIEDAFFVFDEQRLVGNGAWVKSFQRIAKKNRWVLLTATPGDTWIDYVPVFIANGLYRNPTQFKREHVIYASFTRYPKIVKYIDVATLEKYRNMLLVEMPYEKHTERIIKEIKCSYNQDMFNQVYKKRWNPYLNKPLKDVSEMFRVMRKVVNSDPSRLDQLASIMDAHPRVVVFYNFDYELEILRTWLSMNSLCYAEWNGHKHEPIPETEVWAYLVQYQAGAEAWECTYSDCICFYSLTYSYRNFVQSQGRIDRMGTPYKYLYYYVFWSDSVVDKAILNARRHKKTFNERAYARKTLGLTSPELEVYDV
jgi:hypothetical protein